MEEFETVDIDVKMFKKIIKASVTGIFHPFKGVGIDFFEIFDICIHLDNKLTPLHLSKPGFNFFQKRYQNKLIYAYKTQTEAK